MRRYAVLETDDEQGVRRGELYPFEIEGGIVLTDMIV